MEYVCLFCWIIQGFVGNNQTLEDQKSQSNKCKSKNLTSSIGYNEALVNVFSTFLSGSHVSVDCNSHADVSSDDGGEATNEEG